MACVSCISTATVLFRKTEITRMVMLSPKLRNRLDLRTALSRSYKTAFRRDLTIDPNKLNYLLCNVEKTVDSTNRINK